MNRDEKSKEIEQIKGRFQKAKALIFATNNGLKVSEVTELRKKLKSVQSQLQVVKNRLVKRALKDASIEGLDSFFEGPIAMTSSDVDPVSPAKVLVDFMKEHEALVIKGGYLSGEILTADKIKALAALPSREVLYAKLLGTLLNPARQLVGVLAAMPRQLVGVIDAIKQQKEQK